MTNQQNPMTDKGQARTIAIGVAVLACVIAIAIWPASQGKQALLAVTSTPTNCDRVNTEMWSIRCSTSRSPDGKYIVNQWSSHYGREVFDVLTADGSRVVYDGGDFTSTYMSAGGCIAEGWRADGTLLFQCSDDPSAKSSLDPDTGKVGVVCTGGEPVFSSSTIQWSPDGRRIAMTAGSSYSPDSYYVVDKDGSHLVYLGEAGHPAWLDWSPDGRRIVFTRGSYSSMTIEVIDSDGAHLHELAAGNRPRWSPDGMTIAFVREDGLYRIDPDGTAVARIAPGDTRSFAWSPDGKTIALKRADGLFLTAPDGSNFTRIAQGEVRSIAWSPDGSRLAAVMATGREHQYPDRIFMHTMGDQIAAPVMLSDDMNVSGDLAWSPDGQRIAFAGGPNQGGSSPYVMDSDGKNRKKLAGNAINRHPLWKADSRHLIFTRYLPDGREGVTIMNLDDGTGVDLNYDVWLELTLSSDGQTFAMTTLIRRVSVYHSDKVVINLGNIDGRPPVDLTALLESQFRQPCKPQP